MSLAPVSKTITVALKLLYAWRQLDAKSEVGNPYICKNLPHAHFQYILLITCTNN